MRHKFTLLRIAINAIAIIVINVYAYTVALPNQADFYLETDSPIIVAWPDCWPNCEALLPDEHTPLGYGIG